MDKQEEEFKACVTCLGFFWGFSQETKYNLGLFERAIVGCAFGIGSYCSFCLCPKANRVIVPAIVICGIGYNLTK